MIDQPDQPVVALVVFEREELLALGKAARMPSAISVSVTGGWIASQRFRRRRSSGRGRARAHPRGWRS
jgi:hypothetical protein